MAHFRRIFFLRLSYAQSQDASLVCFKNFNSQTAYRQPLARGRNFS
jgi:hypothetical protein